MLLCDKVLASALRLCIRAAAVGWGGKGSFILKSDTNSILLYSLQITHHQCFSLAPALLHPYLPASPCRRCDAHPYSKTHLQGASPEPPMGSPGAVETCFRSCRSSCLYFKAPVEWDWDCCHSLARGKVSSGSVHTRKDFFLLHPLLLYSGTFLTGSAK